MLDCNVKSSLAAVVAGFSLSGVFLVAGCSKEAPPPAAHVADVTAITVATKDAPAVYEFVGQTQSSREVEIRARVDGFLERRVYTEGALVRAGETLFLMDSKPFEATLQQARGELSQQQAKLQVAEANLARVKPLAEQNAVSKKDLDDAVGNEQSSRAAVLSAQGSVRQAELNLSYATINSPLAGLSSFAKIQDGAYISPSNNLLTTVAQLDPMWVNFSISENEHLRFRDAVNKGDLKAPADGNFEIQVLLADGSVFQNRGRISFADPSFSKETGTFLVRSTFANPKGVLKPGQFVRVHLLGITRPNAIMVPQRAVQQGAKSHFVWVVGKDGKAEQRAVIVGEWSGDDWVILQGLRAGEQIVVDGAIRVAPGATLKVTPHQAVSGAASKVRDAADPTIVEQRKGSPGVAPKAAPEPKAESRTEPEKSAPAKDGAQAPKEGAKAPKEEGAKAPWPAQVRFAYREATLDDAARGTITGVAAALKSGDGRVEVTGYADAKGSEARNAKIAAERAKAVRDALVAGGVAADRVVLKKPAQVVGSGNDAEARRVEITLIAG